MGKEPRPKIVISAINLVEGGPLSVLKDCLQCLTSSFNTEYDVIAMVHSKDLFQDGFENIEFVEYPKSKASWFYRVYYEYFHFLKYSKKNKIYLWFSLHDTSPRVRATRQAVYCHNPTPFYKPSIKQVFVNIKEAVFSVFYLYLYKLNIKNNKFVVVQQNWFRSFFSSFFPVQNIIVAHPNMPKIKTDITSLKNKPERSIKLFYPALPRPFKNFELILMAHQKLSEAYKNKIELILTIDENSGNYAKHLIARYNHPTIKLLGQISREEVYSLYQNVDYLIFPSKLETWGMPISEFKLFKKPIIISDLPYAHETVGNYESVLFVDAEDSNGLKNKLENIIDGKNVFTKHTIEEPAPPYANNWKQLFEIILNQ